MFMVFSVSWDIVYLIPHTKIPTTVRRCCEDSLNITFLFVYLFKNIFINYLEEATVGGKTIGV